MSVPASDGLMPKGTLTHPPGATGRGYPLAVLAHQHPATRDSHSPLIADLLAAGVHIPEGVTLEAFGAALFSCVAKVGFLRDALSA
jgi:hypothetical protein